MNFCSRAGFSAAESTFSRFKHAALNVSCLCMPCGKKRLNQLRQAWGKSRHKRSSNVAHHPFLPMMKINSNKPSSRASLHRGQNCEHRSLQAADETGHSGIFRAGSKVCAANYRFCLTAAPNLSNPNLTEQTSSVSLLFLL